jgi:hypothetical protein
MENQYIQIQKESLHIIYNSLICYSNILDNHLQEIITLNLSLQDKTELRFAYRAEKLAIQIQISEIEKVYKPSSIQLHELKKTIDLQTSESNVYIGIEGL